MLHGEAVPGRTLALLKRLCAHPALDDFGLVRGTSLALRFGHRMSVDLDFFRPDKFAHTLNRLIRVQQRIRVGYDIHLNALDKGHHSVAVVIRHFNDLHTLLKHFAVAELVGIYVRKFPNHDPMIPIRSMIYFEDAEETETPKTLIKTTWLKVKSEILAAVRPIL